VKHLSFYFLFFLITTASFGQFSISEKAEISIITVGPGSELFDKFGHTAIRVKDENFDKAYNYGVYDFDAPGFYTNFAKGKLLYILDVWPYDGFLNLYKKQNRWVKEQILDLSYEQKQQFFFFLQNNALPENRGYLYDFCYDNCATRPRDVVQKILKNQLTYDDSHLEDQLTFRQLIQKNVAANSWGSLGMDVAIGAVVDRKASPWEHQFIPEYFSNAIAHTSFTNRNGSSTPLVKETRMAFENDPQNESSRFITSPLFVFGIIGIIILLCTYKDIKKRHRSRYLDAGIFAITGFIGIALAFLWWGTDHTATVNNYNLLWAFPLSLVFVGLIAKKQPKRWMKNYVLFLLLCFALLILHWITGVQRFAIGFIPLFIALFTRYIYVFSFLKKQHQ